MPSYDIANRLVQWETYIKKLEDLEQGTFGRAEIQTLTIAGATGGNFRLGDGVSATTDLAYNISAANLAVAINGLKYTGATVEATDGVYTITFTYATGESGLVIDNDSLTPGTATLTLEEARSYKAAVATEPTLKEIETAIGEVTASPTTNTVLDRLKAIYTALLHYTEASVDTGTATDGSNTTIEDTDKNWTTDIWKNALCEVEVGGVEYIRYCNTNSSDTITITALDPTSSTGVVISAGDKYKLKIPVAIQDIERWGGTQQTGRDLSADLEALTTNISKNTVRQGNVTLAGTSMERLPDLGVVNFVVQANPDNVGDVYIGTSGVTTGAHLAVLAPGSSLSGNVSNLNKFYVVGTSGDMVSCGGEVNV